MKRIFTLILLAGAMLAGLKAADGRWVDDRWVLIASSQDRKVDLYIDNKTLVEDGGTLVIWEKFVRRSGDYFMEHMQVRRDRRYRILSITAYNANGDVTASSSESGVWEDVTPGSLQEALSNGFDAFLKAAAANK